MKKESLKSEVIFQKTIYFSGLVILLLLLGIFFTLLFSSLPSIKAFGLKFLTGRNWNPVTGNFAALPFLAGTLLTSFLALLISIPFSLSIALLLGEYSKGGVISSFLTGMVELLAGIPSVIYGFWGLFILVPVIRFIELKLGLVPYGVGIFTASLILSVMIIPYSASLGKEVINLVPRDLKEAAYSLGGTKFEVIKRVILPYARSGIFAGILLSLGRALGETMAVTMVIGNSHFLPSSIFSPSNTMASVIANEFTEAVDTLYLSSLIEIGLLLFLITTIVNIAGRYIINKVSVEVR